MTCEWLFYRFHFEIFDRGVFCCARDDISFDQITFKSHKFKHFECTWIRTKTITILTLCFHFLDTPVLAATIGLQGAMHSMIMNFLATHLTPMPSVVQSQRHWLSHIRWPTIHSHLFPTFSISNEWIHLFYYLISLNIIYKSMTKQWELYRGNSEERNDVSVGRCRQSCNICNNIFKQTVLVFCHNNNENKLPSWD